MTDPTGPAKVAELAQLHVVGTPIGNLGDFTPRAQEVLEAVALIACEDTRRTGLLLANHGIANPGMVVMNEHTEHKATERILEALGAGDSVAIVSDAGMPIISDPGAVAVAAAVEAGFEVTVAPGPTAVSAALALAGFGSGRFVFEGFLPRKGKERSMQLGELADERRIIVLYEAPHRLERTLSDLADVVDPARSCVVAREITKMHETVWRGQLGDAAAANNDPRGEYVIVIDAAAPAGEVTDDQILARLRDALAQGASTKDASADVAKALHVGRNRVYRLATSQA